MKNSKQMMLDLPSSEIEFQRIKSPVNQDDIQFSERRMRTMRRAVTMRKKKQVEEKWDAERQKKLTHVVRYCEVQNETF